MIDPDYRRKAKEEFREAIRDKNLMDDDCMTNFFSDNIPCVQLTLRIIMNKDDLIVKSSRVQHVLKGFDFDDNDDNQDNNHNNQHERLPRSRSVRLDVYAVDSKGRQYDIEIQNDSSKASPQRARYNNAMLDAHALRTGDPHKLLKDRESVVIFITRDDVLKEGLPIYRIERIITETDKPFNDGSHIVYVNASIQDSSTALGRLMHDFHCSRSDEMFYQEFFDKKKEGEPAMGVIDKIMDECEAKGRADGIAKGRAEGIAKGRAEGIAEGKLEGILETSKKLAVKLVHMGTMTVEQIAELCEMNLNQVQELAAAIKHS